MEVSPSDEPLLLDDGPPAAGDDCVINESSSVPATSTGGSAASIGEKKHLIYTIDPFQRIPHRLATFALLVLSCVASLFTDSNSVPPLELIYPACFLSFVVGTRSNIAAVAGLIPLVLCRSISATDYFRVGGFSTKTAYTISLVIISVIWGLVLGAAIVQKRIWLTSIQGQEDAATNKPGSIFSHPWLSPLVFPLLVTALYQIFFRFSPIGAAGNPAMGLAFVPALRQTTALFGEIFLVFLVGWFAAVIAGTSVGRSSTAHTWFFAVISFTLCVYGWIREDMGMGVLLEDIADWPLARAGASPLRVACITGADDADTMIARTNSRLKAGDDLIIWSEFAVSERVSPEKFDWLAAANNSGAVVAMAYGEKTSENKSFNSIELLQAGQTLGRYNKNRPVPIIESDVQAGSVPPTSFNTTFTPLNTNATTNATNNSGREDERTNLTLNVATAICFDFDFPYLFHYAHNSDLAIGPSEYWASLGRNLWGDNVYRAIENGFTLIKCAEDGISGAVDPYGRTLAAIPTMHNSVHLMEVPVQAGVGTVYANGGFVFGWLCVAIAPILLYFAVYRDTNQVTDEEVEADDYQYFPLDLEPHSSGVDNNNMIGFGDENDGRESKIGV